MTVAAKLYEIVDAYERALQWIDENEEELIARGGELPPDVAADLDEIEDTLPKKVEQVGLMVRQLGAFAKVSKEEADRLNRRAKALENARKGLTAYLLYHLQRAQETPTPKLRTPLVTVWGQANSTYTVRPKDPSNIPDAFRRAVIKLPLQWKAWKVVERALNRAGVPTTGLAEEEFDKQAAHEYVDQVLAETGYDLPLDQEEEVRVGLLVKRGVHGRVQ